MRIAAKPLLLHLPKLRPTAINVFAFRNFYWFPTKTPTEVRRSSIKTLWPPLPCQGISMAASPPPTVHVRDTIELTDVEKKIFDRLLGTLRHFGLQNQLRVAGGWVRDKVCKPLLLLRKKAIGFC